MESLLTFRFLTRDRKATSSDAKMYSEGSLEERMYEPIRKWLSDRGYTSFTAVPKALPKNPFSLDFGVLPSGSNEYKHPDVFAFKWKSSGDDEREIDTLAIECKTGEVAEGMPQAIAYLPFFHKVYVATPTKKLDEYTKKVLKTLCCGYITLENNKPHIQLEVERNSFFDKDSHNKQIRHRLITFLTLLEAFSEKIESLGGLEKVLLNKIIRTGEASQDDGYLTIGYAIEEPFKYLQYTIEFVNDESADFFLNLERKPAAEVIFQFLRDLEDKNTILDSEKVQEFSKLLEKLSKDFYVQLRAERRAVPGHPDCQISLVSEKTASEIAKNSDKLFEFIGSLRGVIFETRWLSYMEGRMKLLKYMPDDDKKLLMNLLPQKNVDKGWRPHLIIGTVLWDSEEFLTRREYISRMRDALSKLNPLMNFLYRGGKIED